MRVVSQICIIWDKRLVCTNCRKTFEAIRGDAVTCSPGCRKARERRLRTQTPSLPTGTFDLLLVDLPLAWHGFSAKGERRSPQRHYDTMDIPALCRLGQKVKPLVANDAVAAFWVYGPRLFDLPTVMKAFGFEYSGEGFECFDWIKVTNEGRPRMVNGKTPGKAKRPCC